MAKPVAAPQQYLFVSNREINVGSLSGRSILFEKGVPTHVPREMHAEVMEKGILPCDKDGKTLDSEAAPVPEEKGPLLRFPPEDAVEREEAVKAAVQALMARNSPKDFSAGGVPTSAAVSAALGYSVAAADIRPVWDKAKVEHLAKA